LLRILDANANRLREGLRTLEEYVRFVENSPRLTRRLKALRHQLRSALSGIPEEGLLAARNSGGDIGKPSNVSERARSSLRSVAAANFKRCQEAARVMEEYAKLLDSNAAERFKEIRFALYDLEKRFVYRMKD